MKKNRLHTTLVSLGGIYNLDSSTINGKPSWTSISNNSLWHIQDPLLGSLWLMGPSEHIGTMNAMIFSALGNQCPFKLQSVFWNMNDGGLGWLAIPEKYQCAIKIDCSKN